MARKLLARTVRKFAEQRALFLEKLDSPEHWMALNDLCELESDWARALVGAKKDGGIRSAMRSAAKPSLAPAAALEAAEHLASAEKWQKQIASFATGSGEGFVAMGYVDELMLARAWMLVAAASNAASAAKDLCRMLHRDREDLEANQKRDLEKLRSALK
ncbi:MAG: hypothetical protein M3020_03445 [Myxococcota bacterium]|jgi:ribosomal protein L12E/L44/L45/RPP1/RPP2|nr:hypothetical protein [Myxococcota bacterium]